MWASKGILYFWICGEVLYHTKELETIRGHLGIINRNCSFNMIKNAITMPLNPNLTSRNGGLGAPVRAPWLGAHMGL